MECETVLDLIELVRPGSDDFAASEFDDARQHVETCESCAAQFAKIQAFDRAVMALTADSLSADAIDVLEGLKDRINGSLAKSTDGVTAPEKSSTKSTRRRVFQSACAALLLFVAAVVSFMWDRSPTQFTVAALENRVPFNLRSLDSFEIPSDSQNLFAFRLPNAFSANLRLKMDRRRWGQDLDGDDEHDLAVTRFSYGPRGRAPFEGIVASIPLVRVKDAKNLPTSFSQAEIRYAKRAGGLVAIASWRERDRVFICIVIKSTDLETIQIGRAHV
jgi:hypothetical protein